MPVGIEAWIAEIPPVTRAWLALSVTISIVVQCQFVTSLQLYFSFRSAFLNLQPWRAVTTFLYFGPMSRDFLFHLFFTVRYSRILEESSFANKQADYLWLLLQSAVLLLVVSPLFSLPYLSHPLAFVPIYVWARQHPSTQVSVFGLATVTAPYFPFALVLFSWITNGTWRADLAGCIVGHVVWFLKDVWSREAFGGIGWYTNAPAPMRRWFGQAEA
ncbi:hypothetical protein BOTBODRAFT_39304 [Botryobasidium botryosum FD-172 SS1]|uniref:Derlin n=1 Tax=Botryobasidium botryosum (strain FD-172 SS1) TaxID=930990 RepID=A0A067M4R0_BOTB1|nr:hypothetical protein BOTBODRAFT_39304 [Botryobasidium botryosum FD-172 SS1]